MGFEEYQTRMTSLNNNIMRLREYLHYMSINTTHIVTNIPEELEDILNRYITNKYNFDGNLEYNLKDEVIKALFSRFNNMVKYGRIYTEQLVSRMLFPITYDFKKVQEYNCDTLIDMMIELKLHQKVNEIMNELLEEQRQYYSNEATVKRILTNNEYN